MSGAFQLVGGAADPIAVKLTSTSATIIAQGVAGEGRKSIPWIRCTEITGNTPDLTLYVENPAGTKIYIRSTSAMTARESLLFEEGYVLLEGWKLYAQAGTADRIDVLGLALLGDAG